MRLLLVGEVNPYGSSPDFALYHLPRTASGNRLRRIFGLSDSTYEALEKANLCYGTWSMPAARDEAVKIQTRGYDVIVLLGRKVMSAFRVSGDFFHSHRRETHTLVCLPHPSGLSREWNVTGRHEMARRLLRSVAPDVTWGESTS